MTPFYKATLRPRLLILAAMLAIAASVLAGFGPTLTAVLQLCGGIAALGGALWFLMAYRRFKKP